MPLTAASHRRFQSRHLRLANDKAQDGTSKKLPRILGTREFAEITGFRAIEEDQQNPARRTTSLDFRSRCLICIKTHACLAESAQHTKKKRISIQIHDKTHKNRAFPSTRSTMAMDAPAVSSTCSIWSRNTSSTSPPSTSAATSSRPRMWRFSCGNPIVKPLTYPPLSLVFRHQLHIINQSPKLPTSLSME